MYYMIQHCELNIACPMCVTTNVLIAQSITKLHTAFYALQSVCSNSNMILWAQKGALLPCEKAFLKRHSLGLIFLSYTASVFLSLDNFVMNWSWLEGQISIRSLAASCIRPFHLVPEKVIQGKMVF